MICLIFNSKSKIKKHERLYFVACRQSRKVSTPRHTAQHYLPIVSGLTFRTSDENAEIFASERCLDIVFVPRLSTQMSKYNRETLSLYGNREIVSLRVYKALLHNTVTS